MLWVYMLFGILLMGIPCYVLYVYKIPFFRRIATSLSMMSIFLLIMGLVLFYVYKQNSALLNLVCLLLMIAFGSYFSSIRSRLPTKRVFVPLLVGFSLTELIFIPLFIMVVFSTFQFWQTNYMLPMSGLLTGWLIQLNSKALSTYYVGLIHHGQLYNYMIGNGATQGDALRYFFNRAVKKSVIPSISRMSVVFLGTSPMLFWGILLMGGGVFDAIKIQFFAMLLFLCSSVVSVFITIYFSRYFYFDAYLRLKKE